jgi:large-conductance mechanosensitive channel
MANKTKTKKKKQYVEIEKFDWGEFFTSLMFFLIVCVPVFNLILIYIFLKENGYLDFRKKVKYEVKEK